MSSAALSESGPKPALAALGRWVNYPALVATILWAGNKPALKISLGEMDPLIVGGCRMLLAGVLLLALAAWREGDVRVPRAMLPRLLLMGAVGMGINSVCFLMGLRLSTVSNAALINTLSPVFCMLMVMTLGVERVDRRTGLGVVIALIGVGVLLRADAVTDPGGTLIGDLLLLGAAVTWAAYCAFGGRVLSVVGPMRTSAYTLLAGAGTVALASPLMVTNWDVSHVSVAAWGGVLYAAILSSVVGLTLWNVGIRKVGPTATMVYNYLAPVLAIGLAAALLGETLGPAQAFGGVVVLLGLTVSTRARGK